MTVSAKLEDGGKCLTIDVSGRFDFAIQQAFRAAYQSPEHPPAIYRVNLSRVEFLDSAALGMLNLLRKQATEISSRVVLVQPSATIRKVLLAARFDKLFVIEG